MHHGRHLGWRVVLAVIAGPVTMIASAETLIDNGRPNGVNGYSNVTAGVFGSRRTVLDDFTVPDGGWVISEFHWYHMWNAGSPPLGDGAELTLWSDASGAPGKPIRQLTITSYKEQGNDIIWFSRPEAESWVTFDDVSLTAGTYWIEWAIRGPENNFALTADDNGTSECWLNYDDFGGLQPGRDVFGVPAELAWSMAGSCLCLADLDCSGAVDFNDILAVLAEWGNAGGPEDLDGDGVVGFGDILVVLGAWGPCE